jgi:outer membrane autotransporter protein
MKKLAIMAILATAAITASATDIGVRYVNNGNTLADSTGFTLGQKFGNVGAELAFDRSATGAKNDRYSLLGSYDVTTVLGATVAAKAGASFVQPSVGESGYAAVVGAGVSYPLTKSVSAVADYSYQHGQDRVKEFNGNAVSVGVKFSF